MVKKDLVAQLWLKFPDFRRKDLELILDLFFERLGRCLGEGHRIEIRGFGRFLVKQQQSRLFKNPKTHEVSKLPARKRVIFRPGKDLKERLNQEAWASLDLGTQTFRLLLAKPASEKFRVLSRERINVRLGEGLAEKGEITPQAFSRGIEALKELKTSMEKAEVKKYLAAGTAVFREASNAADFLEEARRLGIEIRVLSPEEEAFLTARGVLLGFSHLNEPLVIVDVGGGSTEVVLVHPKGEIVAKESLPIGAVVLTKAYLKHEIPKSFELASLENRIKEVLSSLNLPFNPSQMVATGGTASCLVALHLGLERYHPDLIHGRRLSREDLETLFWRLKDLSLEERRSLKGMEPGREDIILAGLKLYLSLMEHLGLRELLVSETGILEGLLLHLKEKITNISSSP